MVSSESLPQNQNSRLKAPFNNSAHPLTAQYKYDRLYAVHHAEFCSGFGQYHSVNNKKDPQQYHGITIGEIEGLAKDPQRIEKENAQWVIPSTLPSRVHAEQREAGHRFGTVWADDLTPEGFSHRVGKCILLPREQLTLDAFLSEKRGTEFMESDQTVIPGNGGNHSGDRGKTTKVFKYTQDSIARQGASMSTIRRCPEALLALTPCLELVPAALAVSFAGGLL
jgi:hypothetical protein